MTAIRTLPRIMLAIAVAEPLTACSPDHDAGSHQPGATEALPPRAADVGIHRWRDTAWQISIDVPPGWTIHPDFSASYLANGAWKTYAGPDSQGSSIVALVVPGSNHVTDAEIRIGASKAASEVRHCTAPPDAVLPGSIAHETIDGVDFTTFEAADAAMSHDLDVHSYRAVRGGACYAIDLLVYGTNPQVFDPPVTPPFSRAEAFARMRSVLASLRVSH
jgi:hypothetical protein